MKRSFVLIALAFASPIPARAASISPKQFVEHLYAAYGQPDAGATLGKRADSVFSPKLLAAIRADQRAHAGEVGKLDHDPLCDCQDPDGLNITAITVTSSPDGAAQASVNFRLGTVAQSARLSLTDTPVGWRVDDVETPAIPSLQKFLTTP